jgi:hypothetical protein
MANYFPGVQRLRSSPVSTTTNSPPATGVQSYSGQGLPSITPAVQSSPAVYESLNLNLFLDWDTNSLRWRSRGQVKESISFNLPANAWTRLPLTALIARIDEYTIIRDSDGVELDTLEKRHATSDGWPEVQSLTAYNGLTAICFGEIVV